MTRSKEYAELLEEAGGDPYLALALSLDCYDTSRRMISAGYARANTSKLSWKAKPSPDVSATSDDWLKTPGGPE